MAALLDAPGHYRRSGAAVTEAGEVHHIGPPAERVPHLMMRHWGCISDIRNICYRLHPTAP